MCRDVLQAANNGKMAAFMCTDTTESATSSVIAR